MEAFIDELERSSQIEPAKYDDTYVDRLRQELEINTTPKEEIQLSALFELATTSLLPHAESVDDPHRRPIKRCRGLATQRGVLMRPGYRQTVAELPRLLFDTGAKRTFLSSKIARLLDHDALFPCDSTAVLPDGSTMPSQYVAKIYLAVGSFRMLTYARVIDLDAYDIILGEDWMKNVGVRIDYFRQRITARTNKRRTFVLTEGQLDDNQSMSSEEYMNAIRDAVHFPTIEGRKCVTMLKRKRCVGQLFLIRETDSQGPVGEEQRPRYADSQFTDVIEKHAKIFANELPEIQPGQQQFEHVIDTGDAEPVNILSYKLSIIKQDELRRQVKILFEKGLIRPSKNPWGFPVVFVKKGHQKPTEPKEWRMYVDFRMLNIRTKKNTYPLPLIEDCLNDIGNAIYISKFDLTMGYHQVRVRQQDIEKTAFNTPDGKYEYVTMPFGLVNAPATFQGMMNEILAPYRHKCCVVYLDDIVVYSNSAEEHRKHLDEILTALKKHQLIAKPTKSIVGAAEIEFCGHIVGNGSIKPSPEKTAVIREWPKPRTAHDIRQFVGLAAYYRKFIRGFADIAAPLFQALKKSDVTIKTKRFRKIK